MNGDLEHGAKVDIRLHNCPETMIALKNLKAAYIGISYNHCSDFYNFFFFGLLAKVEAFPLYRKESHFNILSSFCYFTDKQVSVRGTAVKVSTVRPLVVEMSFECSKCKQSITRIFPDGKYSPPSTCNLNGCKSKFFNPLRSTAQTIDFQKIRSAWCLTHYLYSLTYVGASVH